MTTPSTTIDPGIIELRCDLSVTPGELAISYALINHGNVEFGVLNRLWSHAVDGSLELGPNNVFVELEDDTLHLVKGVLPVPPSVFEQLPQHPPFASQLLAGGTVEERIVIALPARVRTRYWSRRFAGQVVASRKATATKVSLWIGFVPIAADCRLVADQPAYKELLRFPVGLAAERQIMAESTVALAAPIDVLDLEGHPR